MPNLAVAFFLSFFAAGAGQFYLGRKRAALGWLGLATLGSAWVAVFLPAISRAGFFMFGGALLFLLLFVRPLSALDTLRRSKINAARPSTPIVAAAFVGFLALIILTSLLTRAYLLEAFKIPAGSMLPTLLVGDHVFVDKKAKEYRRGHLAVFEFPEHRDQDFVKRVVGIGGDRIEMRAGGLFINGWAVPRCPLGHGALPTGGREAAVGGDFFLEYLDGEAYVTLLADGVDHSLNAESAGPWTVKPGEAFMLGDNRDNSHDSRFWNGGAGGGVPADHAKGEPFVVWLSVGEAGMDRSRTGISTIKPSLPKSLSALEPALARCLAARPALAATTPPPP